MGNTHASWRRHLGLSVHIRDKTVEDIAAIARDSGVPYLEIVAERFWDLPDGGGEIRWQEIKNLLIRYKLRPIVHSSYIDLNMASLNRLLREAAVQQNLRCLEFAAFLEAEHLVVHPGNLNRNYPASLLPEARACLQESLKSLTAQAESLRVTIALENGWNGENHPLIQSGDEHAELIESVGSSALKAVFDLGHANTFGVALSTYLDRVQLLLAGIHLHDNGGTKDEHLPLGKGTIHKADVQRCFEAGVPVVLEMNTLDDISTSLAYLEVNTTSA
jgi:sugar phosphate isomerase/epimerase